MWEELEMFMFSMLGGGVWSEEVGSCGRPPDYWKVGTIWV